MIFGFKAGILLVRQADKFPVLQSADKEHPREHIALHIGAVQRQVEYLAFLIANVMWCTT